MLDLGRKLYCVKCSES